MRNRNRIKSLAIIILLCCMAGIISAQTYYIDSDNGLTTNGGSSPGDAVKFISDLPTTAWTSNQGV